MVNVVHIVRCTQVAISDTAVEQTRNTYVSQGHILTLAKAKFWLGLSDEDDESCPLRSTCKQTSAGRALFREHEAS